MRKYHYYSPRFGPQFICRATSSSDHLLALGDVGSFIAEAVAPSHVWRGLVFSAATRRKRESATLIATRSSQPVG